MPAAINAILVFPFGGNAVKYQPICDKVADRKFHAARKDARRLYAKLHDDTENDQPQNIIFVLLFDEQPKHREHDICADQHEQIPKMRPAALQLEKIIPEELQGIVAL